MARNRIVVPEVSKVPAKVNELCALLQEKQKAVGTFREQYELSFNAHLNLVTIHPWVDGNGRAVEKIAFFGVNGLKLRKRKFLVFYFRGEIAT